MIMVKRIPKELYALDGSMNGVRRERAMHSEDSMMVEMG